MGRQFIGIGDCHLDSTLSKYIPNINRIICEEIDVAIEWGIARGIKSVILYGDIGNKPQLTDDAHKRLLSLFYKYADIRFIVVKGNHDTKSDEENGLRVLHHLHLLGGLQNVKFVLDKPELLFKNRFGVHRKVDPGVT